MHFLTTNKNPNLSGLFSAGIENLHHFVPVQNNPNSFISSKTSYKDPQQSFRPLERGLGLNRILLKQRTTGGANKMSKNPLPKHKTRRTLFQPPLRPFQKHNPVPFPTTSSFTQKPQICPKNSKKCVTMKPKTNSIHYIYLYNISRLFVK
jgi:hypothetical protein